MAAVSIKHIQMDKATQTMVFVLSVAAFLTIFSLVSSKALLSRMSYQNKVSAAKQTALNALTVDIQSSKRLESSYQSFESGSTNVLGGTVTGSGTNTGDNAQIILDSLPSTYDYPALTTSVQDILSGQGVTIDNISGTDESASLAGGATSSATANTSSTAATSQNIGSAVPMPFQFSVTGTAAQLQNVFSAFEKSIRPFQFQTVQISGNQGSLTLAVTAQSFYQPAQNFAITSETIR